MKQIPVDIVCFKGAEQICGFVKEDPRQILHLIDAEGLPAWKREGKGPWRALNVDLMHWMAFQRNKYLKDTPAFVKTETSKKEG